MKALLLSILWSVAALCLGRAGTSDGIGLVALVVLGSAGGSLAVKSVVAVDRYLLQVVTAAVMWPASSACFCAMVSRRTQAGGMAWMAVPLALAGVYRGVKAPPAVASVRVQEEQMRSAILAIGRVYHYGESGEVRP